MAEKEKTATPKDLRPRDGVTKREDHGDFEVVYGVRGEITVLPKEGVEVTSGLRQRIIDKSIELSATPVEEDVRHSSHPDFALADGTKPNAKDGE